jgi:hypothetical protein
MQEHDRLDPDFYRDRFLPAPDFSDPIRVAHKIRFRWLVGDSVLEQDLHVTDPEDWLRMVSEDPLLASWSTATIESQLIALSPPPIALSQEHFPRDDG